MSDQCGWVGKGKECLIAVAINRLNQQGLFPIKPNLFLEPTTVICRMAHLETQSEVAILAGDPLVSAEADPQEVVDLTGSPEIIPILQALLAEQN